MPKAEAPATYNTKMILIREEFIGRNLKRKPTDPPITLKVLAEEYGVPYGRVRDRAAREKWTELLSERAEEKAKKVADLVMDLTVFDELATRIRHATYAKTASNLAMQRISAMTVEDVKKLPFKDVLDLLRLGLSEERKAVGMPDSVNIDIPAAGETVSDRTSFVGFQQKAERLLEMVRGPEGEYALKES